MSLAHAIDHVLIVPEQREVAQHGEVYAPGLVVVASTRPPLRTMSSRTP